MKRRNFLVSGCLGFIGMHSVVGSVSYLFPNDNGCLMDYMSRILHLEKYNYDFPVTGEINENINKIMGSYFDIGYQIINNKLCCSNDNIYICLQLKVENKVLDEVALIFNRGQESTFIGSLSSRQMYWVIENQNFLDELTKKHNVSLRDLIIPKDDRRWQVHGKSLYSTAFGYFMYAMVHEKDIISVDCSVLDEHKKIVLNNITKSFFYPLGKEAMILN